MSPPGQFGLEPWDEANRELVDHVHPEGWRNPSPAARYDLVVLGGGTAGLVCAVGASAFGVKVALVERHLLGGDCLNTGCVPSKTLIAAGRAPGADFSDAMTRVRRTRAALAPHDSAARLAGAGVDVFFGAARFADRRTVVVGDTPLSFRRAVIATGARPRMPPIPGLVEARPLTTDTVFNLMERPSRLVVIGAGPAGCELAQAFASFGAKVVLVSDRPQVLDREDPDVSEAAADALGRSGVDLVLGATVTSLEPAAGCHRVRVMTPSDAARVIDADAILVCAGRIPNVEDLDLAAGGVVLDGTGRPQIGDDLRTSNPAVYACGDVALPWHFTHAADATARIVVQNALFARGPLGRRGISRLQMSWCTFLDPEVAHVGLSEVEARRTGIAIDTYRQPFAANDRARIDGQDVGFVKVHTDRGSGTILGATIVGARAGDLIAEIAVAMAGRVGLGALAGVVHPYPTYAEAIRRCGDDFNRARLTPRVARVLRWWASGR